MGRTVGPVCDVCSPLEEGATVCHALWRSPSYFTPLQRLSLGLQRCAPRVQPIGNPWLLMAHDVGCKVRDARILQQRDQGFAQDVKDMIGASSTVEWPQDV